MNNIFISYSNKDVQFESRLRASLEMFGAAVLDPRSIPSGSDWFREKLQAIAEANVAVCLISSNYLTSSYALAHEIRTLLEREERHELILVPVLLEEAKELSEIPWLQGKQTIKIEERAVSEIFNKKGDTVFANVARNILSIAAQVSSSESARLSLFEEAYGQYLYGGSSQGESTEETDGEVPMPDPNYEAYLRDRDRIAQQHGSCVVAYADGTLVAVAKDAQTLVGGLPSHYKIKPLLIKDIPESPVRFRRPRRLRESG